MKRDSVSIIVPTYREAENIPELVERLEKIKDLFESFEVFIMDDNSPDETQNVVANLKKDWLKLIVRKTNRGLSPAVIDGMKLAQKSILLCMDADLSHPPEAIPAMVDALTEGHDFVVGSRYIEGGKLDEEWTLFRRINSLVATAMARPFTNIKDPMSGFFALRRESFERADRLNPIGYKIGLELIVKAHCKNAKEIPIHFADRVKGESKLNMKEQLRYLQHILRLASYKISSLFKL